jgi:hypothetical protein
LIEIQPSPRSLKRALLVCLRCIDLDANKRPKMGQIVHMLEADDFPFRSVSLAFQPYHITQRINYVLLHSFDFWNSIPHPSLSDLLNAIIFADLGPLKIEGKVNFTFVPWNTSLCSLDKVYAMFTYASC